MKQLLQSPRTGEAAVEELPAPLLRSGYVQVRTARSLISAGTERMAVDFARKSLLEKARSRPDLARKVWDKARRDGILSALESAFSRLDEPQTLGYSASGVVIAVGDGVTDLSEGDRVACAGAGYASHAEIISVPRNLVARIPDGVSMDAAAFATVAAVGLHGIRLAEPTLGETFVVIGLGLIGQLTVQMLRAAGCRVVGVDLDPDRVALARTIGVEAALVPGEDDVADAVLGMTGGTGADAVIITAATPGNAPTEMAAELARDRGRVVAVGAVGMDLPRRPFFEKELEIRVSRSYGPGRYDPVYEEGGVDYPVGYVRWTEGRNLESFLELVARGSVDVDPLITHRVGIEEAAGAYDLLTGAEGGSALGILIEYPEAPDGEASRTVRLDDPSPARVDGTVEIGALGAGNFPQVTLFPAMGKVDGLSFRSVCTTTGPSSIHAAKKFGFAVATTDPSELLEDEAVDLVAVLTPHHLHAEQVVAALERGKHVFCEKPLALDREGLAGVVRAWTAAEGAVPGEAGGGAPLLMVGFNRRFAPMVRTLHDFMGKAEGPLHLHYRVNAGRLPADHWLNDPQVGGGRIIGEGCHFIDLLTFLVGADPVRVSSARFGGGRSELQEDVSLLLEFADGSAGTIVYAASGAPAMPKEYLDVVRGSRSAELHNFRELVLYEGERTRREKARFKQDKGHRAEWEAVVDTLAEGAPPPIPFRDLVSTTLASFAAVESLKSGAPVEIDVDDFLGEHAGGEHAGG